MEWTNLTPFPDPRKGEFITAPLGAGIYELYDHAARRWVLVGYSKNVAYRMTSLLPKPFGAGHRSNKAKQDYIYKNLSSISYRTKACHNGNEARKEEQKLLASGRRYVFVS